MSSAFSFRREHRDWKALYRAAIFEKDRGVIPERISQAEQAVIARERELSYGDGTREERNALDNALHALRAFRRSWEKAHAV
jgi:hypothetical protein